MWKVFRFLGKFCSTNRNLKRKTNLPYIKKKFYIKAFISLNRKKTLINHQLRKII